MAKADKRRAEKTVPKKASAPSFVACSDWHLSLKPPVARSAEPDWMAAQDRVLGQVVDLANKFGVPLLVPGDLFDRWNPPPEVVNLAIRVLRDMKEAVLAVPGQHDLPNHSLKEIKRSAYWTLAEAGVIISLRPGTPAELGHLRVWGFPWGVDPNRKPTGSHDLIQDVALVHRYLWMKGTGFPGARDEHRVKHNLAALRHYDVSVFGDNHTPFFFARDGYSIINCGGLQRRTHPEREHRPRCWLVRCDNTFEEHLLDVSEDLFTDREELLAVLGDERLSDFLHELSVMEDKVVDFTELLNRVLAEKKIGEGARRLILRAMEGPVK